MASKRLMSADLGLLDARILIVDDKAANVALLERLLHSSGYRQVSSTQDPFSVAQRHRAQPFDLILLDLQMPGLDGFAVMQALHSIEPEGYIPVLAITVQPNHKLRALNAGARDFVAKPFDLTELKSRIHNLLEVRLLYTRLTQAARELQTIALHDALTGLPNRRLLLDRLAQALQSSAQNGHQGALMFMDLDQFKLLNDSLGHELGDVLLQQVGQRLRVCVRAHDSVARFGGDEFVVLLACLSSDAAAAKQEALAVAQGILHALEQSYNLQGHTYACTISIGITTFCGEAESTSSLLKMADMAMYRAKAGGRNQVCLFDLAMKTEVQARDALLRDMRHAIGTPEFELFYQVQVDARGVICGAEALLRWKHPRLGLLLPAQFLALAQETKLILPLAQWVLETACAQLRVWAQDDVRKTWTLTVNVGANQLAHTDFVSQVTRALQMSGAPAQRLTLEITEECLRNNVEDAITKMHALHAVGVGFSLDNFGAGFASLVYLRRLPLARLKVDQVMVQAALCDSAVAVIARAIVALGTNLNLPMLAEGIETLAQHDYFADLGCRAFQGNYFSAPMPIGELYAFDPKIGPQSI